MTGEVQTFAEELLNNTFVLYEKGYINEKIMRLHTLRYIL